MCLDLLHVILDNKHNLINSLQMTYMFKHWYDDIIVLNYHRFIIKDSDLGGFNVINEYEKALYDPWFSSIRYCSDTDCYIIMFYDKDGKKCYNVLNNKGDFISDICFDAIDNYNDYYNEYFIVRKDDNYKIMDKNGNFVSKELYKDGDVSYLELNGDQYKVGRDLKMKLVESAGSLIRKSDLKYMISKLVDSKLSKVMNESYRGGGTVSKIRKSDIKKIISESVDIILKRIKS